MQEGSLARVRSAQHRYVSRPTLYDEGFSGNVRLPFGLKAGEVRRALEEIYDFLHDMNCFLVSRGYDRLEEIILGNSLSGFISELAVKRIGANSKALARNEKIGGHPDLIPRNRYPENAALRAEDGVEVKTSIQSGMARAQPRALLGIGRPVFRGHPHRTRPRQAPKRNPEGHVRATRGEGLELLRQSRGEPSDPDRLHTEVRNREAPCECDL